MPLWVDVLRWAAYGLAILPLVLCVVLRIAKRDPVPDAWLLSAAFAVSFFMDWAMRHMIDTGASETTAWVGYLGYPIQFALLGAIVAQDRVIRIVVVALIVLMTVVSLGQMAVFVVAQRPVLIPPETAVRVVGGFMVGYLIWGVPSLVRFRVPVMLYCLACIPGIMAMVIIPRTIPEWFLGWGFYKVVQIMALGWMAWAVAQPHLREVTHEPRSLQAAGPRVPVAMGRGPDRVGGGHRHIRAAPKR